MLKVKLSLRSMLVTYLCSQSLIFHCAKEFESIECNPFVLQDVKVGTSNSSEIPPYTRLTFLINVDQ